MSVKRKLDRTEWLPLYWTVEYDIVAELSPVRTLRGRPQAKRMRYEGGIYNVPWLNLDERRRWARQFRKGGTNVVWVHRDRPNEAGLVDDPILRYDREVRSPNSLPPCDHG